MGEHRMFAKSITESDAFREMPLSSQALYFHLSMDADDDGFTNRPKTICRILGANDDDLKILIAKRFVIPFESGILCIKHWRINNYIRKDRYKPTNYKEERATLTLKENGAYTFGNQLTTTWQPNDNHLATQSKSSQDKLSKVKISQSICERLTDEEFKVLDATYEDLTDLIDLIDDRNQLSNAEIRSPYAYIIKVANAERWPTKG